MAYNTLKGTVNFSNSTTGSIESMVDDYSNQTVAGVKTFSSTVSASAFWDTTKGVAPGNVTGVDSATDRSLMVANGTSGKAITGSNVVMDPAGNITAPGQTFTVDKLAAGGSGVTSTGPISGSAAGSFLNLNVNSSNAVITSTGIITGSTVTASYFVGDGSNLTSVTAAGTPGGSNTQVQFNSGSSFGGSSNFVFLSTGTNTLKVVGDISASNDFQGGNDATFKRDLTAGRDISASNDIYGGRDLAINRDGTFVSSVTAGSTVSGSAFWDTTAGAFMGPGNVTGVDSATDRSLMVANGTSGKAITGSNVTMDPAGNISAPGQTFTVNKLAAGGTGITSTGDISGSNDIISQRDVICNRDITVVRDITVTRDIKSLNDFSGSQDLFIGRDINIGRDAVITNSMTAGSVVSTGAVTAATVSGSAAVTGATLNCDGIATVGSTVSGSAFWDTTAGAFMGPGNVTGVDSATDRSLMVANGTSGKAITGSNVVMDPAGNINAPGQTFTVDKLAAGGSGVTSTGDISGSNDIISQRDVISNRDITVVRDLTVTHDIKSLNDFSGSQDLFIGRDINIGRDAVITNSMTAGSVVSTGAVTAATVSGSGTVQGGAATFTDVHISGSGTEALRIAKGASDTREIVFENEGADVASIFMNAAETLIIKNESSNDDIQFQTKPGGSATTVMTVDGITAGVGIGTIAPLTKLDVRWDPTGLSDDTGGGDVVLFGSGTLTAGKLYYLHTDGAWTEVDADAVATGADQLLGIALGSDPTDDGVLIKGFFDATTYVSNFSKGKAIYVSTTAASMDTTAPSGTGDFVRIVGYCTDTANVIYFNPSSEWIELA